ncbi:MAG: sulfite exporter TauE/SafE family protein [Desulfobulbaceae bacterium]|nr:sulfite exporter TauE/SafE family protein [Desulfobulbaceae bacterium]
MGFELIVTYLAVGLIAGVLAGLLGVGGGIVIVPMLVFCFTRQGVQPEVMMHMALGTSLASIIFTSISSFMAHHRRGAVDWDIVRRIVVGILLGTFLGGFVAARLSTGFLKVFFCIFIYIIATQMILNKKPKPTRELPGTGGMFGMGSLIGVVSSFVGIGGGSLSVPFMLFCNVTAHRAVGTSAAIGLPIAVAGALSYLINGIGVPGRPPTSLGYLYIPGLIGIVCASVLTAPLGAKLAHSLPVDKLKRLFAIFLYLVATRMLWSILH